MTTKENLRKCKITYTPKGEKEAIYYFHAGRTNLIKGYIQKLKKIWLFLHGRGAIKY